jgi:hypothetical protein
VGRIACTTDGVELYDHEGYVSALLEDGSSAGGSWTTETEQETRAWRAECTCGWAGPPHDLGADTIPADGEYEAVLGDWEHDHIAAVVTAAERAYHLDGLTCLVAEFDLRSRALVEKSLVRGATWEDIGRALHATAEAARHRYQSPTLETGTDSPGPQPGQYTQGRGVEGLAIADGQIAL